MGQRCVLVWVFLITLVQGTQWISLFWRIMNCISLEISYLSTEFSPIRFSPLFFLELFSWMLTFLILSASFLIFYHFFSLFFIYAFLPPGRILLNCPGCSLTCDPPAWASQAAHNAGTHIKSGLNFSSQPDTSMPCSPSYWGGWGRRMLEPKNSRPA